MNDPEQAGARRYTSVAYQARGMQAPHRMAFVSDPLDLLDYTPDYPEHTVRELQRCVDGLADAAKDLIAATILEGEPADRRERLTPLGMTRPDVDVIDQAVRTAAAEVQEKASRWGAIETPEVYRILERLATTLTVGHGYAAMNRYRPAPLPRPELDPEGIALVEGIIERANVRREVARILAAEQDQKTDTERTEP